MNRRELLKGLLGVPLVGAAILVAKEAEAIPEPIRYTVQIATYDTHLDAYPYVDKLVVRTHSHGPTQLTATYKNQYEYFDLVELVPSDDDIEFFLTKANMKIHRLVKEAAARVSPSAARVSPKR